MKKLFWVIFALIFVGCDNHGQYSARKLGGSSTVNLPKGQRLLEVTWKDEADLWYLTEPMDSDYQPKEKHFKQSSIYSWMEGEITFKESR